MNRDEAKFVLQSFRPDSPDAEDPAFAEALDLLEKDQELQAWFEREQAFNRDVSAALADITPPAHLKTEIVAGMNATADSASASTPDDGVAGKDLPTGDRSFWRSWAPMAAAAVILVLMGTQLPQMFSSGPTLAEEAVIPEFIAFLSSEYNSPEFALEHKSENLQELKAFLASNNFPVSEDLPEELGEMNPIGCLRLTFQDVPVGMMCFREGVWVYHVFSAEASDLDKLFPGVERDQLPVYYSDGENTYKVWTQGENVNIVAGKGDVESLKRFY